MPELAFAQSPLLFLATKACSRYILQYHFLNLVQALCSPQSEREIDRDHSHRDNGPHLSSNVYYSKLLQASQDVGTPGNASHETALNSRDRTRLQA